MAFDQENAPTEQSLFDGASPLVQVIALLGIPAAGWVAVFVAPQIPRFMNGQFAPLLLPVEIGSLITVLVLVLMLRACLALPSAPVGFYRNVLDFFALARLHPAVKAALVGLIVLPPAWYLRSNHYWFIQMLRTMGSRALASGDFQDQLQGLAAIYQFVLMGGLPLLFGLHLLSRRTRTNGVLLWVLVPLLFVGTAIAFVVLVTLVHFSS